MSQATDILAKYQQRLGSYSRSLLTIMVGAGSPIQVCRNNICYLHNGKYVPALIHGNPLSTAFQHGMGYIQTSLPFHQYLKMGTLV